MRALVSLGDNIYHGPEDQLALTGNEDDDWYFTYYQPYRYLIDHLPMYPAAGNHDGADEEHNDDRAQLADNFHFDGRFAEAEGRASRDLGCSTACRSVPPSSTTRVASFRGEHPVRHGGRSSSGGPRGRSLRVCAFAGRIKLVCVDYTWGDEEGHHYFDDEQHSAWLDDTFPAAGDGTRSRWQIPFCHHPAWCAGPHHDGQVEQLDGLVPRYERAGVRLVLSGHEHDFQHGHHGGPAPRRVRRSGEAGRPTPDEVGLSCNLRLDGAGSLSAHRGGH